MAEEDIAPSPEARVETAESLAERLASFPPEAIESALDTLAAAGVLTSEIGPDGQRRFRYSNPERYKLIDVPVVKQPGPDFGKR